MLESFTLFIRDPSRFFVEYILLTKIPLFK